MSALRLGRLPDGTRDVRVCDDGAVGRTTHSRYAIARGGSFVVGLPKPRPDPRPRSERLFEGIVRCGLWMPRVGEHCYRRVGRMAGDCRTEAVVTRDTERHRMCRSERVEPCVCSGRIRAGSWERARPFVEAHNRSLRHMRWRWSVGIVTPGLGGADDPQRHWPTADDDPVDPVQGDFGASTDGAEGAA